ncbi:amidohydrolase family protein [Micromonospora sp. NPDC050200]|uniref:amidohydrolase family protein n=1 Tax=Micromonospora sp. NPDC050200 TaxID=3155664 RepID=UPI00340C125B
MLEAGSAQLSLGYPDRPGHRGIPVMPAGEFDELVDRAHRSGRAVAAHGIGDAAVAPAVAAYERAHRRWPARPVRHRIEHLEVCPPELLRRMHAFDVIASIQTVFSAGGIESTRALLPAPLRPHLHT